MARFAKRKINPNTTVHHRDSTSIQILVSCMHDYAGSKRNYRHSCILKDATLAMNLGNTSVICNSFKAIWQRYPASEFVPCVQVESSPPQNANSLFRSGLGRLWPLITNLIPNLGICKQSFRDWIHNDTMTQKLHTLWFSVLCFDIFKNPSCHLLVLFWFWLLLNSIKFQL